MKAHMPLLEPFAATAEAGDRCIARQPGAPQRAGVVEVQPASAREDVGTMRMCTREKAAGQATAAMELGGRAIRAGARYAGDERIHRERSTFGRISREWLRCQGSG
jgi:hypothetical protein